MLKITNLEKSYGGQELFSDASLQMNPGERLGLVGRNGHGKSTLFRLILGEERPDSGQIVVPRGYRIGHLAQHLHFTMPTVLEEACLGLQEDEQWDHYKVERILFGLGFNEADMQKAPAEFSGGYQIRLNLAKVLAASPNLLLLDEPTNYLDIVSVRWITQFLRAWPDELIIISHDREFMDSVTTHTAAIHRQRVKKVAGGTAKLYEQIAIEEEVYEKTRVNEEKQRKQIESFVNRFRAQAAKASSVQSRVKLLEKMPAREKLAEIADLEFKFHHAPFEAKTMMEVQNLAFKYPGGNELFQQLNFSIGANDRIAIIGKNGKGKSTLLNVLAGELSPSAGEIRSHPNMKLGYFGQTNIDRLNFKATIEEEIGSANHHLSRTAVRTLCGIMMFEGDAAEKKIGVLSGGERSRVMLGKILAAPANLLFLDEPTNHLDMQSIESLVESIENYAGALVIVTHSEMILKAIATKLIIFQHGGVEVFPGTYEEFLERIGWEEEEKKPKKNTAKQEAPKAKPVQASGKNLEAIEKNILRLEAELNALNDKLAIASQKNHVEELISLSESIKKLQSQIDEEYAKCT